MEGPEDFLKRVDNFVVKSELHLSKDLDSALVLLDQAHVRYLVTTAGALSRGCP